MSEAIIRWPSATVTAELGSTRSRSFVSRAALLPERTVVKPGTSTCGSSTAFALAAAFPNDVLPYLAPLHVAFVLHPLFQRLGQRLLVRGLDGEDRSLAVFGDRRIVAR